MSEPQADGELAPSAGDDTPAPAPAAGEAEPESAPPLGPGPHGVWRLRDLSRAARIVAAVTVVLLMVPVAASVLRARSVGWIPSGDDALIVLRSHDVLSREAPLVGQPSTAESYAPGVAARHPGPAEFYLLALPVRLLDPALGALLTAAAIAGGSVLIALWSVFRRAGPTVALGAAVILGFVMWSSGTAVLSDPISSNVGGYPLLAGSALAWALWCDDRRLWPLAVAVWSFTIQQHLAIFGAAGMVAAWGVAGAAVVTVRKRHEVGRLASSAGWAATSLLVGLVCWAPPLVDQAAGTGNLAKILRFSGSSDREPLGIMVGLRAAGRAVAFPPIILSRSLTDLTEGDDHLPGGGWHLTAPFDTIGRLNAILGLLIVLATGAVAWRSVRRGGDGGPRLALVATGLVLLVAGVITTSQVPDSVEQARINFYRWVWPACAACWGAVAWTIGRWVRDVMALPALSGEAADADAPDEAPESEPEQPGERVVGDDLPGRGVPARPVAVGLALAVLATTVTLTVTRVGEGDTRRDEVLFAFDQRANDAAVGAAPEGRPVRIVSVGGSAYLSVAPALGVALVDAGFDVRVDPVHEPFWDHRAVPPSADETVLCILSAPEEIPAGPGEVLASERLPIESGGRAEVWGDAVYELRILPPGETDCGGPVS